jgi:predicted transcriptional regulator
MRQSKPLTKLQLAVLQALWQRGEATVGEVHAALARERRLAVTTVATLLSRLEKQRLLTHRSEGRQFVYRPLVSEDEMRTSMLAELTKRLFGGDVTAVVSHLLASGDVKRGDLERVKALIEARAREGGRRAR